jgi:alpha-L-fucosidase
MVKELADACREEGLLVGMYLSPWDRNHKDYGKPAYITYYRNQLRELLTNYGPVFEVWFDGANGGDGWYGGAKGRRNINRKTYYDWEPTMAMIRQLQPDAVIFSDAGPDARWVGNEGGHAGDPCWATVNADGWMPGIANRKHLNSGVRTGKSWIPAEADFPLRKGWFWHPGDRPKTPADLVNRYFSSVGRNSVMDIGIAPDRRGLICDEDAAALKGFGDRLRAIFAFNLAKLADVDGTTLTFIPPIRFSVISLRENIRLGERVDDWALDAWQNGDWKEFANGSCIGARRLWRGKPITAEKIRLRITKSSAPPDIAEFAVYLEPESSRAEARIGEHLETGIAKAGWKVVSASSEGAPARNAIDGNPATLWHTRTTAGRQTPQQIVVDMGRVHTLTGFLYLPRQDASTIGNVSHYAFHASLDGKTWGKPAAQGEFGNIKANPVQQKVMFAKPVKGRYFKFVAKHTLEENHAVVAEIGVITKSQRNTP